MENANLVHPQQPENPLARVATAADDGTITSSRCHLCKSQFRTEVERMFDEKQSDLAIKKFLDDKGEVYAPWRIRYHFRTHYKNMEMQIAVKEYCDQMNEMMRRRRNMVDDVEHSISISWIELAQVVVMPAPTLDEQHKKQRIIADLQKTIREGHEFIKSLHDSEAKARAMEERFAKVWKLQLDGAKSEEQKKLIVATLQDFKDKFQQIDG